MSLQIYAGCFGEVCSEPHERLLIVVEGSHVGYGCGRLTISGSNCPSADGHTGAIAEGHYIIEDGTVTLTDVMGKPFPGEQYKRKLGPADDEMGIARQLLRSKASD